MMLDSLLPYIVMILAGYLLGSLPFGLILGKIAKGVDVRDYGSGSTGMTNVMRIAGAPVAALTLFLDMSKAVVSVLIARWLFDAPGAEAAGALAALAGHNWPVFVGFRGGKGTAAGWGALIILSPLSGLVATLVGVPTVALTRYVSLGSILGTLSGVITLAVLIALERAPLEYISFGVVGACIVVGLHKPNILRLIKGEERKLGKPSVRADG